MRNIIFKKVLVIVLIILFLSSSTALSLSVSHTEKPITKGIQKNVQAIIKDVVSQPCLVGNVKVSSNKENDLYPRMTTNAADDIIIVYEQEETENILMNTVPVVYSIDRGNTWAQQFVFNSIDFQGSGFLSDPDIIYNPAQDILWVNTVDRVTEDYPDIMYFIPGDIATATEAIGYAMGWASSTYCFEVACTHSNDYYLNFISENYPGYDEILGLVWFCYPDFSYPPGLGGSYFDGQSMIRTAPVAELEADYNSNRWFLVAESGAIPGGTQIVIKSGTTNKTLIDSREQQNGMDKYGDIEQAPGEFLGLGTDPDVSGSGNMVAVVFVRDGNIMCSVSSCAATYEPEFNWQTYTVDGTGGASTPAVYMQGNNIYVAYVKSGNLYYKYSQDSGATWSAAEQKNDVNGTVITEKGSIDVCEIGIAFTDNRNGNYDIYFATLFGEPADNKEPTKPNKPTGQTKGKLGQEYLYTTSTTDPNQDKVYYMWDWGDGTFSEWLGPYKSGVACAAKHIWDEKYKHNIKVKAKDIYGKESSWSDPLGIIMPKNKFVNLFFAEFLHKLLDKLPILQTISKK